MSTLEVPPVSAIADVLKLWGIDGWLTPPLLPFVAPMSVIIGEVVTISVVSAPTGPSLFPAYSILSRDLSGCFVVIGGGAAVAGAIWGEIMSTAAAANDALGVLIDGSVRDRPAMTAIGLPVYATGECVVGPNGTAHVTQVGGDVQIGDVMICARDSVVADATGCVRVRQTDLDDVLEAAWRYADAEEKVVQALVSGEPLTSAYALKKSVVDELRR